MRDLVDDHRANIAKASVTLAEAIKTATSAYSSEVAASEATLEIAMERRISVFSGVAPTPETKEPEKPPMRDGERRLYVNAEDQP